MKKTNRRPLPIVVAVAIAVAVVGAIAVGIAFALSGSSVPILPAVMGSAGPP